MQFSTLLTTFILPLLAAAADNSFNIPPSGWSFTAGKSATLAWTPSTSGTVTLVLRNGISSNLNTGTLIARGISNSGSYTWSVPNDITKGTYTVEIIDDTNQAITNYSPYFPIDSTNTTPSSTGVVSGLSSVGPSATASVASLISSASVSASKESASSSMMMTGSSNSKSSMTMTSTGSMMTTTNAGASQGTSSVVRTQTGTGLAGPVATVGAAAMFVAAGAAFVS